MSWNPALEPGCPDQVALESIETLIIPRARDLGDFEVKRALPAPKRQMVGPFIFFDQAGPAEFLTGQGVDIRPHPHIGLGTVTYLYQGDFHHRDSTGADQVVLPGEVNWMVAGKGVTHSERTSEAGRKGPHSLFGIQTWIALPETHEDMDPTFEHHEKKTLPEFEDSGIHGRLILGRAYGERAPVTLYSDTFYLDITLDPGALFPLPDDHEDRGIYVTQGSVLISGQEFPAGQMMVFRPGDRITVAAGAQGARIMALGGETLNGPRYIWWNFVASSKERIEHAKEAWQAADWGQGMFNLPRGDNREFIPLP
ncbi:MAG TPA: pirin family protein [Paracoccus sp. (in: a-proteobacteria)]|uniref:pirin family protein n=1 Tax=Paracoccus sp. TaxID=267 RepID=UPI002CC37670|nr:pirin family protein [Paracoccus sp. (in: a-proteobacteria)]HWL56228.1 pirin family protein [Paracoccus sp. (in: a-proteobacteria)]